MSINFKDELQNVIVEGVESISEDDKIVQSLAKKHTAPLELIALMVEWGINVEMEHSNDYDTAIEIVFENLTEDPTYYKKLLELEDE